MRQLFWEGLTLLFLLLFFGVLVLYIKIMAWEGFHFDSFMVFFGSEIAIAVSFFITSKKIDK